MISENERTLLCLVGQSLKTNADCVKLSDICDLDFDIIYPLADRHQVLALLWNISDEKSLPPKFQEDFRFKTAKTIHKGITLQSLALKLTTLLQKEGITAVTLKGYAISRHYPVPEFRKTADVDLFFESPENVKRAVKILYKNGFKSSDKWHANHHHVMISPKNEVVELHTSWADEFKDRKLNKYLERVQKESISHCVPIEFGEDKIYGYETSYQAFYLIIHALQHFVGGGFGIRNLCDWVVLWENCGDEKVKKDFLKMASESGTENFAKAVTSVCVKYLGLDLKKSPYSCDALPENDLTDEFLRDILDAGEFGYSEHGRMVGMDGNSPWAYVKEFHHQMHINFPKAGRVVFLWPVLWIATLIRFLNNNRRLSRGPVSEIMKKAGSRGTLVKRIMKNK